MDLYKSRDNIYKTIDLRSAQLPAEMTCMLDVIGVTPSSGPGMEGMRASPALGGPTVACSRLPGRASVAPLGPEEVYFSEELLRQTLGRCRACSGPRPPADRGATAADGTPGVPEEHRRSLERAIYADAVVNRRQVSPLSTFFSSSSSSNPRQISSRGLSIPPPHESSLAGEKLYEKTDEGRTNQIAAKTDYRSHVTTEEEEEEAQLKKL